MCKFRQTADESSATSGKKLLQQCCRLCVQQAADYDGVVIEARLEERIRNASARAGFGVARAVNNPRDARVQHRAGAHDARLERHVELTAGETVIAETLRGVTQRNDFGMRRGVVGLYRMVVAAADDLAVSHDYGTHWHFTRRCRARG